MRFFNKEHIISLEITGLVEDENEFYDKIFSYLGWEFRPSNEDCESGQPIESLPKTVKVVSKGFNDIVTLGELNDILWNLFCCRLDYTKKFEIIKNKVKFSNTEAVKLFNEFLKDSECKYKNTAKFIERFPELPDEIDILIEDGKYKLLANSKVSHHEE